MTPRPLRRARKIAKQLRRQVGIRLGLVPPPADRGYMICAMPRSGSNYVCQLLSSTGVLGNPREYFNTAGRRLHIDPKYPADPITQIKIIRSAGATANGIYGVKIMEYQVQASADRVDVFRALPNLRLIRLDRGDIIAQAISLARARQTQQFASDQPARRPPHYNAALIRTCLQSLLEQRQRWNSILDRLSVQPLTLEYSEIVGQPQQAVDQVASLMGLASPASIDPQLISHKILRDEDSAAWRAQFLADTGDEFRQFAR